MTIEEALSADARRLRACLSSDLRELDTLMADGCLYIHTAGNIDTKAEFMEKVRTGALRYISIDNTVERAAECMGAVAIAGVLAMELYRGPTHASIRIRYCCTWISTSTGPQMLTWQSTALAAA